MQSLLTGTVWLYSWILTTKLEWYESGNHVKYEQMFIYIYCVKMFISLPRSLSVTTHWQKLDSMPCCSTG